MPKLLLVSAVLLALAGSVWSAEDEIDTDLMQSIEDTNKDLASNIAVQEAKAATANARDLHEMFAKVEAFYVGKGDAADAVDLARKSLELTQQIEQQIASKDFGAATGSATTLSRTCKSCHNFYKKS